MSISTGNHNAVDTAGARLALRVDLNDCWTVAQSAQDLRREFGERF